VGASASSFHDMALREKSPLPGLRSTQLEGFYVLRKFYGLLTTVLPSVSLVRKSVQNNGFITQVYYQL
jgi:hypothetical protein